MVSNSKKQLFFVTSNLFKFEIAKQALQGSGIRLIQRKMELPEIQSEDVSKVAAFSARTAFLKIKKSIVVSDAGYYIRSLKGFPGPFVKYINQWLTAEDILKLISGKKDRRIDAVGCLGLALSEKKVKTFTMKLPGMISKKAYKQSKFGSQIDRIFIPQGMSKPLSALSKKESLEFWQKADSFWDDLVKFLNKNN